MKDKTNIERLLLQQQWEASFFQIVEQYSERLMVCALQILKDPVAAEDALQEALISIWKNLHHFKGDSKPYTWCYSIVRNSALNELRKAQKQPSSGYDSDVLELLAGAQTTSLPWDSDQIEQVLLKVLKDLPEKQRMVFEMRYYQELSFKEIHEITGVSEGGLKANFHHAKQKVQEKLVHTLNLIEVKPSKN